MAQIYHQCNAFPKYIYTTNKEFLLKFYKVLDLSEKVESFTLEICESKDNEIIKSGNDISEQYSKK